MSPKVDKRSYPDARLVIGNGFDLNIGLKSSYSDYFKYRTDDYSWFKDLHNSAIFNQNMYRNYDVNQFPNKLPDNLNLWDLVFYLLSTTNTKIEYWCDVERVIQKCLFSDWELSLCRLAKEIRSLVACKNKVFVYDSSLMFLVKHFVMAQIRLGNIFDEKTFYRFLKEELNKFEANFIEYIKEEANKIDYLNNARNLVGRIVGTDKYNVTQVDSFNYTNFNSKKYDYFNINGDYCFPIFGIDNSEIKDADDERKIFTKQYRRLERIIENGSKQSHCGDECIYIYGHSLNVQDYDYFFTLFDRIDVLNDFDRKIVFAYSIYDKGRKKEIKNRLVNSIYTLFFAYEKSKGISNPNLVTALTGEGKMTIKEVK